MKTIKHQYEFFTKENGKHFCYGSYTEDQAKRFAEDMGCTYKLIIKGW